MHTRQKEALVSRAAIISLPQMEAALVVVSRYMQDGRNQTALRDVR